MALDDILKGLGAFQEGMQGLAISTAANDAHSQVADIQNQLRAGTIKENDAKQQFQQLSEGLALNLLQAGAGAGQIQAATSQFGLTAGQQADLKMQQERMNQQSRLAEMQLSGKRQAAEAEAAQKQKQLVIPGTNSTGEVTLSKEEAVKTRKLVGSTTNTMRLIADLRKLYEENEGTEITGAVAGRMSSLTRQIQLGLKESFNLGVLNGPDLDLMETIAPNLTGLSGVLSLDETIRAQLAALGSTTAENLTGQLRGQGLIIDPKGIIAQQANRAQLDPAIHKTISNIKSRYRNNPNKQRQLATLALKASRGDASAQAELARNRVLPED